MLSLESLVVLFTPLCLLEEPMVVVELSFVVSESSDFGGVIQSETETRDGATTEVGALVCEDPVAVRDHVGSLWLGAEERQGGPESPVHVPEKTSSKLELSPHQFPMDVDVRQMSNGHADVAVMMKNRTGQDRMFLELLSVVVVATGLEEFSASNQQMSELSAIAAPFFRGRKRVSLKKFPASRNGDLSWSAEALFDDLVGRLDLFLGEDLFTTIGESSASLVDLDPGSCQENELFLAKILGNGEPVVLSPREMVLEVGLVTTTNEIQDLVDQRHAWFVVQVPSLFDGELAGGEDEVREWNSRIFNDMRPHLLRVATILELFLVPRLIEGKRSALVAPRVESGFFEIRGESGDAASHHSSDGLLFRDLAGQDLDAWRILRMLVAFQQVKVFVVVVLRFLALVLRDPR